MNTAAMCLIDAWIVNFKKIYLDRIYISEVIEKQLEGSEGGGVEVELYSKVSRLFYWSINKFDQTKSMSNQIIIELNQINAWL